MCLQDRYSHESSVATLIAGDQRFGNVGCYLALPAAKINEKVCLRLLSHQSGRIIEEPLPKNHILRSVKNTLLTPHIGYVSSEAYEKFFNGYTMAIKAYLSGRVINKII